MKAIELWHYRYRRRNQAWGTYLAKKIQKRTKNVLQMAITYDPDLMSKKSPCICFFSHTRRNSACYSLEDQDEHGARSWTTSYRMSPSVERQLWRSRWPWLACERINCAAGNESKQERQAVDEEKHQEIRRRRIAFYSEEEKPVRSVLKSFDRGYCKIGGRTFMVFSQIPSLIFTHAVYAHNWHL
jgi:hypothetical protein